MFKADRIKNSIMPTIYKTIIFSFLCKYTLFATEEKEVLNKNIIIPKTIEGVPPLPKK